MKGRESGMPESQYWDSFCDPPCILTKLDCQNLHGKIVEFGCGYGTFTIAAASRTSDRIVTFDIEPEMVAQTVLRLNELEITNCDVSVRDFVSDGTGLEDQCAQYAMLFNILHIEDPIDLLTEAARILVPGGKIGVIHWRSDIPTPRGPSIEIRPQPETCTKWGEQVGLNFIRSMNFECCQWHWGMVLRKPNGE